VIIDFEDPFINLFFVTNESNICKINKQL